VCGILGTYDIAVDAGRWAAMSDTLAHRGPDAAGTWTGPDDAERVRLGHRRLSIIDLSAAAGQPFVKDGLVLVFNGEIYNYRQLRAGLGGAGISFRTSSDTEVLLEAWRRWGPASPRRLRRDLADMVEDLVAGETPVASGLVDKQMVRTMIDPDRCGAADRSKEIWQLLTLEVWYRQQGSDR
jgi:asparagine synthase (glutamine-hydrolysing)